ncbi:MAG: isoamylase early set domain-containing protein [Actinomycetota bacterium]|jgi:endonuclease/exonuclease/phosphatase (EEP) superfamily protein YafD
MIEKQPTRKGDKVKVTFVVPDRNDGGQVFVAGDFNAWSVGATPLRQRDGVRVASLTLVAGRRYAFRYYQNGHWFNDDDADDYVVNEFGEQNGILDLT